MTYTYTYAILEVSERAYEEIKRGLLKAGYKHALTGAGREKNVLDMHGIALQKKRIPARMACNMHQEQRLCKNGVCHQCKPQCSHGTKSRP
jgi:hypothetical protein